uniref:Anaphase-promoting complex subunit 2 TPR repeats domain-containing protein n=1 Tax=Arundo donax TaxID=35708 RepID=A0A0A9FTX4_ARUDO
MRLEYFAYETLQDLRICKLFKIIVDYPESLSCYRGPKAVFGVHGSTL